ncbi:unnamed protein product, partial [Mesorhabditis spiculigera]
MSKKVPPKWKNTPKGRGAQNTISVLQSWARKTEIDAKQRERARSGVPETVTLEDDETLDFEEIRSTMSVASAATAPGTSTPISSADVPRRFSSTPTDLLKESGALPDKLAEIRFPISEITRRWERDAVHVLARHNAAVAYPNDANGANVAAMLFFNFLRWFPNGRCVCTTHQAQHADAIRERCRAVGIAEQDITTLAKVCEQNQEIAATFRCLVLVFESPGEAMTKYKKSVDIINNKLKILCRFAVLTPRPSSGKAKSSAVGTRQILITNLGLGEWTQFGFTEMEFRDYYVDSRVGADYWDESAVSKEQEEWAGRWRQSASDLLRQTSKELQQLPSVEPQELFYADWSLVEAANPGKSIRSAVFAVEAYRNLVLSGPRAFYLFCYGSVRRSAGDSEEIQMLLATNDGFRGVYEAIHKKYRYCIEDEYDIRFKHASLSSHPKWLRLRKIVEDFILIGQFFEAC